MMGGAWFGEVFGSSSSLADVEEVAIKTVSKQLNITAQPVNIVSKIIKVCRPLTIQSF